MEKRTMIIVRDGELVNYSKQAEKQNSEIDIDEYYLPTFIIIIIINNNRHNYNYTSLI